MSEGKEDCKITPLKSGGAVSTIRENSEDIRSPKLSSALPAKVRDIMVQPLEKFKNSLDRHTYKAYLNSEVLVDTYGSLGHGHK